MNTFTTHPRKLILFTALSLADLVLTCILLRRGGGRVYEGNPVADWWLDAWGWTGLVAFKVLAIVLATVLTAAISRRCMKPFSIGSSAATSFMPSCTARLS